MRTVAETIRDYGFGKGPIYKCHYCDYASRDEALLSAHRQTHSRAELRRALAEKAVDEAYERNRNEWG